MIMLDQLVASAIANRALEEALTRAFQERGVRLFVLRRESLCKAAAVFEHPIGTKRGFVVEYTAPDSSQADQQLYDGLIAELVAKLLRMVPAA